MQNSVALDAFDLKLLAALQDNGQLSNQELANRINLSASQCSRRRIRSSWVPISTISPLVMPTMRSQWRTAASRCAMTMTVRPRAIWSMFWRMMRSLS